MVAGNGEQGSSGNVMEALLTMLLSDRYSALSKETAPGSQERTPEAEALRKQIYESMKKPASDAGEAKPDKGKEKK